MSALDMIPLRAADAVAVAAAQYHACLLYTSQLLQAEAKHDANSSLAALAKAGNTWQPRASIDSVSYRSVRAWRLAVHARIADGLTAPAQAALGEDFLMPDLPQLEGVVWPLLVERPAHLLPRRFDSWEALLEDAATEVRDELAQRGPLEQRNWGERNTCLLYTSRCV